MRFSQLKLIIAALFVPLFAFASVTVVVNGSNHTIPQTNERGWGTNVTAWIQAISANTLQPSGGTFTLTAETDFGATYGLKTSYLKTRASNPATSGVLRLAVGDSVGFRNNANSGNLLLGVDGSDHLTFTGGIVATSTSADVQDSTFNIYDNGDNTKKLAFQVSGVTTGTTRTWTVPDSSDTFVGKATTDTFTNKSISGSTNTLTNISLATAVTGVLPLANGGTNKNMTASAGAIAYSDADSLEFTGVGSNGQLLQSTGTTAPAFTTATYPSTTTANQLLYSSATNTIGGLTSANIAALITDGSGVPSFSAASANGQVLRRSSGALSFGQLNLADGTNAVTGTLAIANGGTGQITANAALNAFLPTQTSNSGKFLTTDGANTSWGTLSAVNASVVSKTTTYSATTSDDVIFVSGSAFTITLPTAVGNNGKALVFKKTDSSLSNIITIDGNSTETIDGSLTTTLNTQNEALKIISDGTNWQIIERKIPSVWVDGGVVPVSGTTSAPVKPTMTRDKMWWRRVGDSIEVRYEMLSSGTTGTPGVGDYLFGLPTGVTIDTAKIVVDTTVSTGSVDWYSTVGTAICAFQGTQSGSGTVRVYSSSYVRLFAGPTSGTYNPVGQARNNNYWNASPMMYSAHFMVPVSGWNGN